MSEQFLSEIRAVSFNFPPKGWALCNGQFLPINQNQALFSLLGTTYGGDGRVTFALPNLQGKVPVHFGTGYLLGQVGGVSSITLNQTQMPTHTHQLMASGTLGDVPTPTNTALAQTPALIYGPATNLTQLNAINVTTVGGNQPHTNMMPYAVVNYIIALQGIYPSRN